MTSENEWFACCEHCGCVGSDRLGHDDTCAEGCNDEELRKAGYDI